MSSTQAELDTMIQQLAQVDAMRQTTKEIEDERGLVHAETQRAQNQLDAAEEEMQSNEKLLKETKVRLGIARAKETELETERAMNDVVQEEQVRSALEEIERLMEEKIELARDIGKAHDDLAAVESTKASQQEENDRELAKLDAMGKELVGLLASVREERITLEATLGERTKSAQSEIEDATSYAAKLESAAEAEETNKEQLIEKRNREMNDKLDKARSESEQECMALHVKLEMLEVAAEILVSCDRTVKELSDKPIQVDEDCDLDGEDNEFGADAGVEIISTKNNSPTDIDDIGENSDGNSSEDEKIEDAR